MQVLLDAILAASVSVGQILAFVLAWIGICLVASLVLVATGIAQPLRKGSNYENR